MTQAFQHIRDRIRNIQFGILRCKDKDMLASWSVRASPADGNILHCIINGGEETAEILDRDVNLVQKYKNDYLFVTGRVSASINDNLQVISLNVAKACWFEKRSRDGISWLKEKYVYEHDPRKVSMALPVETE